MWIFWLLAAAMVIAAGAAVLVPLWRRRPAADLSRDKLNTALFKERLADLEIERQEGRIGEEHYRQLREELERTLLVDVPQQEALPAREGRVTRIVALGMAMIVPMLALGYYYLSSYQGPAATWIGLQARLKNAVELALQRPETLPPEAEQDPVGFTRALQARLLTEGMQDADGLFLLGISYIRLQAPQAALAALKRAYRLEPARPEIMLAYAQAMLMTDDGRLTQDSAHLLSRVLRISPEHQGALMLFGFGAFNTGLYEDAIQAWQRLLALRDPASEGARLLRNSIARAEELLTEQQQAGVAQPAPAKAAQITVTVDLSPELRPRLAPEDTLFIFAKAASGPPMPLAAVRRPVQAFPVQVVLSDNQAMVPAMKLSHFDEVVVGARISKAGEVTAKPGDLQGSSATLSLAKGPQSVSVLIDQVVQ